MALSKEIVDDTIVVRAPGLVAAEMDGETVMLNIENGSYYGLDGIGSRIWCLLEKPCASRLVVTALLEEYDVEETTCRTDVLAFLNHLFSQGLVQID